ncbi:hypothetical protein KIN20_006444 [Parelaphostrongylus tenuis]|uniref:Elongator complex protein 1 n=1 Tax=Parelaphostrongylus tenuis TaxID=148309 RepID=A0AAD5M3L5_PARTN|nr:hypothetical protein KIN20_006444 [Parelaphostrongylus tenuis]
MSHVVWHDDKLLALAHCEKDRVIKIDVESGVVTIVHESSKPIVWMEVEPSSSIVLLATTHGMFEELTKDGETRRRFQLPPSESYDVKFANDVVIILTPDHDLFVNGRLFAGSVSSYLISDDVCIYITLNNKLRLMSVITYENLGPERSVELGSNLIACNCHGVNVIMQMPRGNLETIHPRLFVIRVIKQLIDDQNYLEALRSMKKHRIDMNLIVDYKPDAFMNSIPMFLQSVADPDLLIIFVAALKDDRSQYCDGAVISDKVNKITELLVKEILSLARDRRIRMFAVVLSALLKSSPPQVEEALRLMKRETDELNEDERDGYTRKWLHHIRFFVNETTLFNAALSTYDLSLTLQVAEMSNRDPKEYLPLLNELQKVELDDYRKFRIDMIREDWKSALAHLSRLDDKWDEAVALICEKQLYSAALIVYRNSSRYKDICAIYAKVLESNALWDEAAVLYNKAGDNEKELYCIELSRNFERYVSRARILRRSDEVINATLMKMATVLKASGRWGEVAKTLEIVKAPAASIIEAYSKAGQWLNTIDAAERSEDLSLVRDVLIGRAKGLFEDVGAKSEEFHRYTKRLALVRYIKKENFMRIKDGIECGKDFEEVDMMSEASSIYSGMTRKTGQSRASTTATVRKRKQIDRKKQSLKEGGEYEDSALLNALAAHYHWLNNVIAEMVELLPSLVRIDELSLASSLQRSIQKFFTDANSSHPQIWPNKLRPWDLPGPLYALYTVDGIFTFPKDGGMPEVVTLENEMIAPVLNTSLRWKLQILE